MKNGDMPAMPIELNGFGLYEPCAYLGLTKREQFAMAAMQSLIGVYWADIDGYDSAKEMIKCLSESAVEHAEELLAELEK